MKKYSISVCIAAVLLLHQTAYAAMESMPWDRSLDLMVANIITVGRAVVTMLVAVTGTMIMFGTAEGQKQNLIRTVFGVALALNMADIIVGANGQFQDLHNIIIGNVEKPAPLTINLTGKDKGYNFVGDFVTYYENLCIYGAKIVTPYALKLLAVLTTIECTMTLMFKLEGDHFKFLLHQFMKIGFFIFLIQNWIGGTGAMANIANTIFTGFEKIGILAAGGTENMKPENILLNGFDTIAIVLNSLKDLGMSSIGGQLIVSMLGMTITLGIFFCVAVTTLELLMARLEFWTIAVVTVVLIPFGAYKHTRFLFEKVIGAIFNLSIKMSIVTFICILSGPLIAGMVNELQATKGVLSNIMMLLQILFGTGAIAVLAWKVPSLASGLLMGQPSLSGGDMFAPAKAAIKGAAAVASGAGAVVQASNMAGGATALNTLNKAGGPQTGWAARQAGTLRNLATMANQRYNPISNAYNSSQQGVRNVMSRNKTNSELQREGSRVRADENGHLHAGWSPDEDYRRSDYAKRSHNENERKDKIK